MALSAGLLRLFRREVKAPPVMPTPQSMMSARPTYARQLAGNAIIPRPIAYRLIEQFWNAIPALGRSIDILTGLVGCPCYHHEDERVKARANEFFERLPVGRVSMGLATFLEDHIAQALLYGYAVGEMEISALGQMERVWTFKSPAFGFKSAPDGSLQVIQQQIGGDVILNPETVLTTTFNPQGCDPNGLPLFFSSHTFCQAWLDIAHAHRSTWLRNGIPIYHVNWAPSNPQDFHDPDGAVASSVRSAMETAWAEAMKSQVVDGKALDFFSTGETSVNVIGSEAAVMDIQVSKRAVVEEIVAATGIPAWMLGYSWSSTERLSTQQADVLVQTVKNLRRAATPTLLKLGTSWARLSGEKTAVRGLTVEWPDVTLQDATETAQAERTEAEAQNARVRYALSLWRMGIWSQEQVAEYLIDSPEVAVVMAEPPEMQAPPGRPEQERGLKEFEEYPSLNGCRH